MKSKSQISLFIFVVFVAATMASKTFAEEPGTPPAPGASESTPTSAPSTAESIDAELQLLFSSRPTMSLVGGTLVYRALIDSHGFEMLLSIPLTPDALQLSSRTAIGQANQFLTEVLIPHYLERSRGENRNVRLFRNDPLVPTRNISPATQEIYLGAEMSAQFQEIPRGTHKRIRFRIIPYRGHLIRLAILTTEAHPCDERCDRFLNSFHPDMAFVTSALSSNRE